MCHFWSRSASIEPRSGQRRSWRTPRSSLASIDRGPDAEGGGRRLRRRDCRAGRSSAQFSEGPFSEGRKEYRIILQKLKVPKVAPPILVKRKVEKMVKHDVGEKTCGKKKFYSACLLGSSKMFFLLKKDVPHKITKINRQINFKPNLTTKYSLIRSWRDLSYLCASFGREEPKLKMFFAPSESNLKTTKNASEEHHPDSEAWRKEMKTYKGHSAPIVRVRPAQIQKNEITAIRGILPVV